MKTKLNLIVFTLLLMLFWQCKKEQSTTLPASAPEETVIRQTASDTLALSDAHFRAEDYEDFDWDSQKPLKEKEIESYDFKKMGAPISYNETENGREISGWFYLIKTMAKNEKGEVKLLAYMSESTLDVYLATYDTVGKFIEFLVVYSDDANANGPTDYFQTEIKNNIITRKNDIYEAEPGTPNTVTEKFYITTDLHFKEIK